MRTEDTNTEVRQERTALAPAPNDVSEEEELFLRELAALEDDDLPLPMGCCLPARPPDDGCYPEFVPDEVDMEQLARSYLDEAISLFCFSFFTGWCEEAEACLLMERFERVAGHLGEEKRRQIIDALDRHRSATDGDQWQVFKYTCKPGVWSTPANFEAVLRVADAVPEELPPEQADHYGPEFLDTLREIREQGRSDDGNKKEV